jgi:hypothetical protein
MSFTVLWYVLIVICCCSVAGFLVSLGYLMKHRAVMAGQVAENIQKDLLLHARGTKELTGNIILLVIKTRCAEQGLDLHKLNVLALLANLDKGLDQESGIGKRTKAKLKLQIQEFSANWIQFRDLGHP